MLFSSPVFLFLFLPLVLIASLVAGRRLRPWLLLLASLFFYFWGEGNSLLLLLLMVAATWGFTRWIERTTSPRGRGWVLAVALAFQLGFLAWLKYLAPTSALFSAPLRALGLAAGKDGCVPTPMGVSFFTFMAITTVVSVSRREAAASRSPLPVALQLALFPQVTSGPIVTWRQFAPQASALRPDLESFAAGVERFIVGLAKKVLLAVPLGRVADQAFAAPAGTLPAACAWLGLLCYTGQIFLDFSGYTDMAVGLGRMLGYRLPENFNLPYAARTVKEFWTRWHMSLTNLLREYVFMPVAFAVSGRIRGDRLLGARAESWAYHLATAATMLLCGVWHGAAWTFVAWGAFHALALSAEQWVGAKRLRRWPGALVHGWTLLVVMAGWVFFRASSLGGASRYFASLVGSGTADPALDWRLWLAPDVALCLGIGALVALVRWQRVGTILARPLAVPAVRWMGDVARVILLCGIFLLSLAAVAAGTFNPFIYARF